MSGSFDGCTPDPCNSSAAHIKHTQLLQPDAPGGLVQPLPCSETSSEQTHGFRFWSTNPGAFQLLRGIRVGFG